MKSAYLIPCEGGLSDRTWCSVSTLHVLPLIRKLVGRANVWHIAGCKFNPWDRLASVWDSIISHPSFARLYGFIIAALTIAEPSPEIWCIQFSGLVTAIVCVSVVDDRYRGRKMICNHITVSCQGCDGQNSDVGRVVLVDKGLDR